MEDELLSGDRGGIDGPCLVRVQSVLLEYWRQPVHPPPAAGGGLDQVQAGPEDVGPQGTPDQPSEAAGYAGELVFVIFLLHRLYGGADIALDERTRNGEPILGRHDL